MKKCKYCENLNEMERDYPKAIHKGAMLYCDECGAEYYEEFMRDILSTNEQAKLNHPELNVI